MIKKNFNSNKLKSFCEKRDVFDCAGIRARVIRLPVDCPNQLSYTGVRLLLLHKKISLYRLSKLPYGCNNCKLGGKNFELNYLI